MFLRNSWYVAALSSEIQGQLVARKILNDRIVIYRLRSGKLAALQDACPHRKLPLSKGYLVGDSIECGYHGLTFNCDGVCVKAPTQKQIPPNARVRSYPITEKYGLVWVWPGNPSKADDTLLIEIENYGDPGWATTKGDSLTCNCNYLYLADNLLDPAHVAWVHRTSFFSPGSKDTKITTSLTPTGVVAWRWIVDQEPPPFYAPHLRFSGNCDRLQHYELCYPSIAINRSVFIPVGDSREPGNYSGDAFVMVSYNFLTPVDERTTLYFWIQHRNTGVDDIELTKVLADGARSAFLEDKAVLELVQDGIEADKETINLGIDAGAMQFRQRLNNLIELEKMNG